MLHALRKDMLSNEKQLMRVGVWQALEKPKSVKKERWEATKKEHLQFYSPRGPAAWPLQDCETLEEACEVNDTLASLKRV